MSEAITATQLETEQLLKLSSDDFIQFLLEASPHSVCNFCGGNWGVPVSPDADTTAIVAMQVPHHPGLGLWYYPITCATCANTIFFNANNVLNIIKSKGDDK